MRQALQLNPNFAEASNNLGIALTRLNRIADGIQQFQTTLKLKPDYAPAHLNLGVALGKAGRIEEAIEQFRETLRLNPNSIDAYTNMAKAYSLMEQPADAIASAEKALALAHKLGQASIAEQIEAWLKEYRAQKTPTPQPSLAEQPGTRPSS